MLKQKHIEAARELRLWLSQVIIPMLGLGMVIGYNKDSIKQNFNNAKDKIKSKFNK